MKNKVNIDSSLDEISSVAGGEVNGVLGEYKITNVLEWKSGFPKMCGPSGEDCSPEDDC